MGFFHIILVIWTSWAYDTSVTGEPQVTGSSQVILAKLGGDVILPCHIKPSVNATTMTVEWTRPDLKPAYVHPRQDGREDLQRLNQLHTWRTSLFAEELSHGNISLKLFRVQLSDEGTFKCSVQGLNGSCFIQLIVGAVSQPVVSVIGIHDDSLSYSCDSGCWYPEPVVSWLDGEGNPLPDESSVTDRDPHHCYIVKKSVTVRRSGQVICTVHQSLLNHTVEIHSYVSDQMMSHVQSTRTSVPTWITLITVMLTAITTILFLKWRRRTSEDIYQASNEAQCVGVAIPLVELPQKTWRQQTEVLNTEGETH